MEKNKKYWIAFFIFLVLFFGFLNYMRLPLTHDWDESRHACASYIYYSWIKNGFPEWSVFIQQMEQKMPGHAGWLTQIDPPFYSFVQAIIFLIASPNFVATRITTELLVCIGALFLFLFSKKILKSNLLGLSVVVLFLLSPISIEFSGVSILAIPIALSMVGWYYFTFHSQKIYQIKYGDKSFNLNISVIIGALFISAATMMKYQSMIFYAGFMIAYCIFLYLTKQKNEALDLIKVGFIQSLIFLLICGLWLKYLFTSGIWERVLYEGVSRAREWTLNYMTFFFKAPFPRTGYLAFFALVPLFFKKGRLFLKENARLIIYVLSVLVIATFLISNRQLRYAVHVVPFVYILIIKGMDICANQKKKIFLLFMVVAVLAMIWLGVKQINERKAIIGEQDYELIDYMKSIPNPKFLLYIHGPKNPDVLYYQNPDMFLFSTMMINPDPLRTEQYARYIYWSSFEQDTEGFMDVLDGWSSQIRTIIIIPIERPGLKDWESELIKNNYTVTELTWYNVYEKIK